MNEEIARYNLTTSKLRIYISGPMTGIKDFNYPEFHRTAKRLREAGFDVVSPAELHTDTDKDWTYYMRGAIAAMMDCQIIYMLIGWSSSRGAKLELDLAEQLGFGVVYEADQIPTT